MSSLFDLRYADAQHARIWSREGWVSLLMSFWSARLLDLPIGTMPDAEVQFWQAVLQCSPNTDDLVQLVSERALELEQETGHDLVAVLEAFRREVRLGYPTSADLLHLGCTSSDPEDYAVAVQLDASIRMLCTHVEALLLEIAALGRSAGMAVVLGRTHLQPAEPLPLGLRFVGMCAALEHAFESITLAGGRMGEKAGLGAVGTSACLSFAWRRRSWWGDEALLRLEQGSPNGQTASRHPEVNLFGALAEMASAVYKISNDLRLMTLEPWWPGSEAAARVGSSAMPGKVNPIEWEKACSLCTLLPGMLAPIWMAAATSELERTLTDSASRRALLPDVFLALAEAVKSTTKGLRRVQRFTDQTADIARVQVLEHWRQWVSARVMTWGLANRHFRGGVELLARLAESAANCDTIEQFLGEYMPVVEELSLYDLLALGPAQDSVEDFWGMLPARVAKMRQAANSHSNPLWQAGTP